MIFLNDIFNFNFSLFLIGQSKELLRISNVPFYAATHACIVSNMNTIF